MCKLAPKKKEVKVEVATTAPVCSVYVMDHLTGGMKLINPANEDQIKAIKKLLKTEKK